MFFCFFFTLSVWFWGSRPDFSHFQPIFFNFLSFPCYPEHNISFLCRYRRFCFLPKNGQRSAVDKCDPTLLCTFEGMKRERERDADSQRNRRFRCLSLFISPKTVGSTLFFSFLSLSERGKASCPIVGLVRFAMFGLWFSVFLLWENVQSNFDLKIGKTF